MPPKSLYGNAFCTFSLKETCLPFVPLTDENKQANEMPRTTGENQQQQQGFNKLFNQPGSMASWISFGGQGDLGPGSQLTQYRSHCSVCWDPIYRHQIISASKKSFNYQPHSPISLLSHRASNRINNLSNGYLVKWSAGLQTDMCVLFPLADFQHFQTKIQQREAQINHKFI